MSKAKKETVAQIAERHGMSRDALNKLQKMGCDIRDDAEIKAYRNLQRCRVPSNKKGDANRQDLPQVEYLTLQEIEQIATTKGVDYSIVRTAREQLTTLTAAQKLRIALAESFSADEVRERDAGIAAAMKMAVMRFETDMPGQCEGLTAMQMKPLMRAFAVKILTDLADAQSPFWDKAEQAKAAAADMSDEQ